MDSILILAVSREMMKLPTVSKAVVVMATDMNKTIVEEFGGLTPEAKNASDNDLILSLECERADIAEMARKKIKEIAAGKSGVSDETSQAEYRSLAEAKAAVQGANLCIISLPSEYALDESKAALAEGMNLFIFSDMDEEHELELKSLAHEKTCLLWGLAQERL